MWVGALLFASMSKTDFDKDGLGDRKVTRRQVFASRWLTYITIGIAQCLVVVTGDMLLLGVTVAEPVWNYLFALIVSFTFVTIVYTLVALFGNVGKGLSIIILVLSISGGGGNFPVQLSSGFFQRVNPLLPFTYAVNLLRESGGGIYWANAVTDIVVLLCIAAAVFTIGIIVCPIIVRFTSKLEETVQQSKIFH
jgi:putative membrane protein